MALTDNNGTQYYGISCGVPSDPTVNINSNTGSKYYWLSANDYILYGQPASFPALASNNTDSNTYIRAMFLVMQV